MNKQSPFYFSEVMFEGQGGARWMEGYAPTSYGVYSNATGLANAQETVADLSKKLSEATKLRDTALSNIEAIRNYLSAWINMPSNKFELAIPYSSIMIGDPNKGAGKLTGSWVSGWNPWTGAVSISTNYSYRTGLPSPEAQYGKSSDNGKRAVNQAFLDDKIKKLQELNKNIENYNAATKDVDTLAKTLQGAQSQLDKISATDPTTIRVKAEAASIVEKGIAVAKSTKWTTLAVIGVGGLILLGWVGKKLFFSK